MPGACGYDVVQIPGGGLWIEPGVPQAPTYQMAYQLQAGQQVSAVSLAKIANPQIPDNLNLPFGDLYLPLLIQ